MISVIQADITALDVEAIVNAVLGGGGVDGAFHSRKWLFIPTRVRSTIAMTGNVSVKDTMCYPAWAGEAIAMIMP